MNVCIGSLAALLDDISLMSAFPESGRSDQQKLGEIKVRFRPQAAVQPGGLVGPPYSGGMACQYSNKFIFFSSSVHLESSVRE